MVAVKNTALISSNPAELVNTRNRVARRYKEFVKSISWTLAKGIQLPTVTIRDNLSLVTNVCHELYVLEYSDHGVKIPFTSNQY
jgi:hypothetical protein